jgi:alkylation response protein AidB-like acyl-CoA dehydrogenase
MNFSDSPEELAFRIEAKAWLERMAPGYCTPLPSTLNDSDLVTRGRAWQKVKAEARFAGVAWPASMGGRGGTSIEAAIFEQEEQAYPVPTGAFVTIGMNMAVPTITKHGTPEQAKRFTQPTLTGDIVWCQLFSEPGAGSDLAALRTRAVRDGNNWIVNGQKVWSSWAKQADFGILLARTDATLPKHKGITFFVVDMSSPGITVRPIKQISGKSDFNEVFLEDVVVPDLNRVGAEGGGWACAMTVLMSERAISGGGDAEEVSAAVLIRDQGGAFGARIDDTATCQKLAHWYAIEAGIRNFRARLYTALSKQQPIGAEAALVKLAYAKKLQEVAAYAMELDGYGGLFLDPHTPMHARAANGFLWSAAMRIAGGADEVLKNQIAERILGMPGEMRTDRDIPFDRLP